MYIQERKKWCGFQRHCESFLADVQAPTNATTAPSNEPSASLCSWLPPAQRILSEGTKTSISELSKRGHRKSQTER
jgi:hypothetical protein